MFSSLLPPALRLLIRLHARGFLRRMFRKAKGIKGIALSIVGGLLFFLWIGMVMLGNLSMFSKKRPRVPFPVENTHDYVPVGMLAISLLTLAGSGGGKGIQFTAAEADFLFPGPYTRRQLLIYRMVRSWVPMLWGAFFFGTGVRRFTASWLGAYLVAFLILIFIQVFSTAASLLFATFEERISIARFRKLIIGGILALGAAALYLVPAPTLPTTLPTSNPSNPANIINDMMVNLVHSPLVQWAALPFKPFAYAMTAPTTGGMLGWSAACIGIIVATLALALRLDADFYEAAAATAAKTHQALDNARRGKVVFNPGSSRLRLPPLPRLAGAGAIIWRQGTIALRSLKVVLLVLVIACFAIAPLLLAKGIRDPKAITGVMISFLAMITFMGGALFRFDFRGDVDRLDALKALPISPLATVVGQLATPVLFMAFFQFCLLLVIGFFNPSQIPKLLAAAAFVPLFSLTFTAVENLSFLLFPHRGNAAPGDLTAMARGALIFLAKLAFLATLVALAFGLFALTRWLTGSTPAALAAAWLTAAACSIALLPLLALVYHRFDIAAEITADA